MKLLASPTLLQFDMLSLLRLNARAQPHSVLVLDSTGIASTSARAASLRTSKVLVIDDGDQREVSDLLKVILSVCVIR